MSALFIRNRAARLALDLLREGPGFEDVEATLRKVDPDFAAFYHALACDAGLEDDTAADRAAAALLQFASVQLADDLADGDCTYLPDAQRTGPGCAWLLHHLFFVAARRGGVPASALEEAARDLAAVGAAQQIEVRTSRWDLAGARAAAIGLNASQHRAYFRLVLAGSPLGSGAAEAGYDFGFALHVCGDRLKGDQRWSNLDEPARQELASDALGAAQRLTASPSPALREQAAWFLTVLRQT